MVPRRKTFYLSSDTKFMNSHHSWADVFNPKYRCEETRNKLTDGHPEAPLLMYVGRLGAEKNIADLKPILDQLQKSHGARYLILEIIVLLNN